MQNNILLDLAQLLPSDTNPRKTFDQAKLKELSANMADPEVGQLQALIVRPTWCQGCKSKAEITAARPKTPPAAPQFEVVDGERRLRAARLAKLEKLRCDVRELTDSVVISIQLITYLQKEGLTPLEEARGFQDLLKLKGETGQSLHTRESIAESVGAAIDYVYARLKLLALPELARAALEDGRIGVRLAALVARVPGKEQRELAAKAIITPGRMHGETLTTREAEHYLAENFMQELKGAPFDTADAELDKAVGSCAACPHRTGNNKELFGDVKRGDICTNPPCYQKKCQQIFARTAEAVLKECPGAKVLTGPSATNVFGYDGVQLKYDSPYVDLGDKPAHGVVSYEVDRSKLPTWEKLTAGKNVPKVLVQDASGKMRTLVDRTLAITAAKENGEKIFLNALRAGGRAGSADNAARKKAEAEAKRDMAIAIAAAEAVRKKVVTRGLIPAATNALLELAFNHAGADGNWFMLKAHGIKKPVDQTTEAALRKYVEQIKDPAERFAIAIELLYARELRFSGAEGGDGFPGFAEVYGVDVKKIKADTIAALKAAKGKPRVTTDPQILASWVKLFGDGMSIAEIAKASRVDVKDVDGALASAKPVKSKPRSGGAVAAEKSFRARGKIIPKAAAAK